MFQKSSSSWQIPSERKKFCKVLDKQPSASIVTYNRFADLNDDDNGDYGKQEMKEKKTKKRIVHGDCQPTLKVAVGVAGPGGLAV